MDYQMCFSYQELIIQKVDLSMEKMLNMIITPHKTTFKFSNKKENFEGVTKSLCAAVHISFLLNNAHNYHGCWLHLAFHKVQKHVRLQFICPYISVTNFCFGHSFTSSTFPPA